MQRKTSNIWIAICFLLLTVTFLLTRERAKSKPALQEIQPPEEVAQQESTFPDIMPLSHPDSDNMPAITIVKKASSGNITTPQTEGTENAPENSNQGTHNPSGASGQKSAGETSLDTSTNTSAPVSGITKANKYPTETEKKK